MEGLRNVNDAFGFGAFFSSMQVFDVFFMKKGSRLKFKPFQHSNFGRWGESDTFFLEIVVNLWRLKNITMVWLGSCASSKTIIIVVRSVM